MLKIGLTGGIGSGKSTIASIFEVLDIPVYYADNVAKQLMQEDDLLVKSIIQNFGESCYEAGKLNRAYLSSIVFNNKSKLELLNSIVHPVTIAHAENWMKNQTAPYCIKEAALIFESNSNKYLDYVIGVHSPENLRINRIMSRDKISEIEIKSRIDAQMNEAEKMAKCDFVINNNEIELIVPQVLSVHQKLMAKI
jgi:dephospho-CoA kinase